jgi:hypothetical protein
LPTQALYEVAAQLYNNTCICLSSPGQGDMKTCLSAV